MFRLCAVEPELPEPKKICIESGIKQSCLNVIAADPVSSEEFNAQRARGSHFASLWRAKHCYELAQAAQHAIPTTNRAKRSNRAVECCKSDTQKELLFVPLDLTTIHVAVFIDASFATNKKLTSQLGFLICLTDDIGTANITHYTETTCQRFAKTILPSELYAFLFGFDQGFVIAHLLTWSLSRKACLINYTDFKCWFDAPRSFNTTTE